jgi:hypothetical protein
MGEVRKNNFPFFISMKIVREALEFERGKSPKSSIGIGLKAKIENYLEEEHKLDYLAPGALQYILEDSELDRETRESWAKFILQEGYDWDENELYELFQQQINVPDNLPLGEKSVDDVNLIKTKEGWEIQFSGWADFAKYFDDHKEFIGELLEGDAWTYFEDSGEYIDISDILYYLDIKLDVDLSDLRKKFIEYGGKENISDEEMLEAISEEDEYQDLAKAIKIAAGSAQSDANEGAAFNHVNKIIVDHFELSNIEWDTDKNMYVAHITDKGVERLLAAAYLEEERPTYDEPYAGYMADWDKDSFEMELENQLDSL